jgi:hypothetical protein
MESIQTAQPLTASYNPTRHRIGMRKIQMSEQASK